MNCEHDFSTEHPSYDVPFGVAACGPAGVDTDWECAKCGTLVSDLPEAPRHRSRKNRRRWCGGKIGREHVWGEWYDAFPRLGGLRRIDIRRCLTCGREQYR